jgi:tellurite resistance protein TerA
MRKGDSPISMRKTATITASASWSSRTDYDLYALVVERDGRVAHVANFGAVGTPAVPQLRGVRLGHDVGRSAGAAGHAVETLTITFDDHIAAVVPVAYSAMSNGTGSFYEYRVTLAVDNGAGEQVRIEAANANQHKRIYTCVPAIIHNGADGNVWVEYVEAYSQPNSELRPAAILHANGAVEVRMDTGPRNKFKFRTASR